MTNQKDQSTILRVQKERVIDIGKNIIRIDPIIMEELGIKTGDVIAIKDKKESAGIAWPSYPQDQGLGIVRFDSRLRKNTGTNIDDTIEIKKSNVMTAQNVVLSPVSMDFNPNPKFETFVRRKLINLPVTLDDIIYISIGIRREISFRVRSLKPQGICQIKQETVIHISETISPDGETKADYVTYEDVGGLDKEIQKIREMVELPLGHPSLFKQLGIDPPKGVLLRGPPGCGKTLLARAVANESKANFIYINGSEIMNKFNGKSKKKLRTIFSFARERSPSIIYIDQIDSIGMDSKFLVGKQKHSIISDLLSLMDGMDKKDKMIIIASTNKPEILDPALRRPGRFDIEIVITPPDEDARLEIFKIHTRDIKLNSNISLEKLAEQTDGFVGGDIAFLCREAKLNALTRSIPKEQLESDNIDSFIMDQIELILIDFQIAFKKIKK